MFKKHLSLPVLTRQTPLDADTKILQEDDVSSAKKVSGYSVQSEPASVVVKNTSETFRGQRRLRIDNDFNEMAVRSYNKNREQKDKKIIGLGNSKRLRKRHIGLASG